MADAAAEEEPDAGATHGAAMGGAVDAASRQTPVDASTSTGWVWLNVDYYLPDETLSDWVSYAEQLTSVTVLSEREIAPPAQVLQRREGYVGRQLALRVDETIWLNRSVTPQTHDFELVVLGWVVRSGERLEAVAHHAPRLQVGGRYVLALTTLVGRVSLLTDMAVIAVPGDPVATQDVARHGQSEGARQLSMLPWDDMAASLDAVPRDPVVEQFRYLPPEERVRAVYEAKEGGTP